MPPPDAAQPRPIFNLLDCKLSPRPHFYGMLRADEMLVKARVCEEMANKATDLMSVHALREAARHWRTMAIQLNLLEQHQAYRIIRDRKDE